MAFSSSIFLPIICLLVPIYIVCERFNSTGRPILFIDEFIGTSLNYTAWKVLEGHDKFGANRSMCFQNHTDNIKVENGSLIITARVQNVDCIGNTTESKNYTSARVQTNQYFNFMALEFNGRISKCEHCQPGFWSQKSDNKSYEEIDSMEVKGTNTSEYYVNAYYAKNVASLNRTKSQNITVHEDLSKDFHTFVVEKTSDWLKFYFDGELKHSKNRSQYELVDSNDSKIPFSEPQRVIISLLIGGNWFNNVHPLTTEIANNWTKPTLEIDRVVVYG